jgi:predicted nuclease with TOPRIM domain
MDNLLLWLLGLLEVIIVLMVMMALLYQQNRRLQRALGSGVGRAESVATDWHEFLQTQINRTRSRLTQLSSDGVSSPASLRLLQLRLRLLEAERAAWDRSTPDHELFWDTLLQNLPAPPDDEGATALVIKDELIQSLQERVQQYVLRVENLETFKTMFFDLKQKLGESQELNTQFHDEITRTIPTEMQSPEMQEMLQRLREENTSLEELLQHVNDQLRSIMAQAGVTGSADGRKPRDASLDGMSNVVMHIESEMAQIRDIVRNQKNRINELNLEIDNLQLEVNDKEHLKRKLQELARKNEELSSSMEHMEGENKFLQEQISTLLSQELFTAEQGKEKIREYETQLLAKEKALNELERKYAAMEEQYLSVFNENERLKQKSA